jgi:signal transduction histidine kinase
VVVAAVAQGWRVEVRDNGRGIPETFLRDHLFRPFRTTKEAGFGIGLYECKTIVEAAGGSIEVQSQVQNGTTVGITLPASPTDAKRDITGYERPHGQTYSLSY